MLTSYKIIHGENFYDLNSKSKFMAFSPAHDIVLAISPVSDDLYLLDLLETSINTYPIIQPDFNLSNYPNPFNSETTISFSIKQKSHIDLSVYSINGQKIKTLIKKSCESGNHSVVWNGENNYGKLVGSGIYYFKIGVNGKTEATKKCILSK